MAFLFSQADEAEILALAVPHTPPSPHELTALEMFFMDAMVFICPQCRKEAESDTVQCDSCHAWLHMTTCAGTPPPEGFANAQRFVCPLCRKKKAKKMKR